MSDIAEFIGWSDDDEDDIQACVAESEDGQDEKDTQPHSKRERTWLRCITTVS